MHENAMRILLVRLGDNEFKDSIKKLPNECMEEKEKEKMLIERCIYTW